MNFRKFFPLSFVGLSVAIALSSLPVQAQQITSATIVEILDSDRVFIQGQKARLNSVARGGQQVRTERARAGLKFNNNASIRIGRNSSFVVGSRCVEVRRGRVVISGAARGCVGSVVAATRGTTYAIEVNAKREGTISVLEGEIEVSDLEDAGVTPIRLKAKQRVSISIAGEIGAIEQFDQAEFENLLQGQLFNGFNVALPTASNLIDAGAIAATPSRGDTGFSGSFLATAISGASDPMAASSSSSSVSASSASSSSGSSAASIATEIPDPTANSTMLNASVTLTTYDLTNGSGFQEDTGIFTDENGTTFSVKVERGDFPAIVTLVPSSYTIDGNAIGTDTSGNVLINGVIAESTSVGLSGNNAVVTVVGQNGEILRLQVFNVNEQEPIAGQTFSGQIIFGPFPDR
ncbi:MAG: hypothetical protein J7647_30800 [Cyanobacteria bacterium SBLK]|nr:hypothetical protein [Cyanobacteria bacterium SBLK]